MARVILLLPNPDRLQLANCHKYVTRGGQRAYSEIYTFKTIDGKCASGVDKLLLIGHGAKGGVKGASVQDVVDAIQRSKLPLIQGTKIAFDTCWGGAGDVGVDSVIMQVAAALKKAIPSAQGRLSGSTGCTVTVGGEKRLVVLDSQRGRASAAQRTMLKKHNINGMGDVRGDWSETASSAQIKVWAKEEYDKLKDFAEDLRDALANDHALDDSSGRKTMVQI